MFAGKPRPDGRSVPRRPVHRSGSELGDWDPGGVLLRGVLHLVGSRDRRACVGTSVVGAIGARERPTGPCGRDGHVLPKHCRAGVVGLKSRAEPAANLPPLFVEGLTQRQYFLRRSPCSVEATNCHQGRDRARPEVAGVVALGGAFPDRMVSFATLAPVTRNQSASNKDRLPGGADLTSMSAGIRPMEDGSRSMATQTLSARQRPECPYRRA